MIDALTLEIVGETFWSSPATQPTHLSLLEHTVEAGGLARARRAGDVQAGGATGHHVGLQEGDDGGPFGLAREQPFGHGSVESLFYRLKLRL